VTVHRDDFGVPHVLAETEEAGAYALGWLHAERRLDVVLDRYLRVSGRSAAALGAERGSVDADVEVLRWGHLEEARLGFARLPVALQAFHRAFVAGLQRFLDEHPERVPPWAPALEPALPLAVERARYWDEGALDDGLYALAGAGVAPFPEIGAELRGARPGASNAWALAPARTADGVAIACFDPHGGPFPARFDFTLRAGGLELAGVAAWGVALPVYGHTRDITWGYTTRGPKNADVYAIDVDPEDPGRYRFDGDERRLERREVTVEVRGGAPVTRVLEFSRHNGIRCPVIARTPGRAYVLCASLMHRAGDVEEILDRQWRSGDVHEWREALRGRAAYPKHHLAADAAGNLLFLSGGLIPVRPDGFDWYAPVPGNTSATAWRGYHDLDELPQELNPPAGYLMNANTAPDTVCEGTRIRASAYPPYLFNDEPGNQRSRGVRLRERLSALRGATVEDAVALAHDRTWRRAPAWIAALRRAAAHRAERFEETGEATRRVLAALCAFDGEAHPDSWAALACWHWHRNLSDGLDADGFRELADRVEGAHDPRLLAIGFALRWAHDRRPRRLTGAERDGVRPEDEERLLDAVERTAEELLALYGTLEHRLGDVFRLGPADEHHPAPGVNLHLHRLPRRHGTGREAVWADQVVRSLEAHSALPLEDGRRLVVSGGHSLRLVAFTRPIRSYVTCLHGASDDPGSPHYSDQARLASEGRMKPTYFEPADLAGHIRSTTTLEVRARSA